MQQHIGGWRFPGSQEDAKSKSWRAAMKKQERFEGNNPNDKKGDIQLSEQDCVDGRDNTKTTVPNNTFYMNQEKEASSFLKTFTASHIFSKSGIARIVLHDHQRPYPQQSDSPKEWLGESSCFLRDGRFFLLLTLMMFAWRK